MFDIYLTIFIQSSRQKALSNSTHANTQELNHQRAPASCAMNVTLKRQKEVLKVLQMVGGQARGPSRPTKVVGSSQTTKRIRTDVVTLTLTPFSMRQIKSIMKKNIGPTFTRTSKSLVSVSIATRVYWVSWKGDGRGWARVKLRRLKGRRACSWRSPSATGKIGAGVVRGT